MVALLCFMDGWSWVQTLVHSKKFQQNFVCFNLAPLEEIPDSALLTTTKLKHEMTMNLFSKNMLHDACQSQDNPSQPYL